MERLELFFLRLLSYVAEDCAYGMRREVIGLEFFCR